MSVIKKVLALLLLGFGTCLHAQTIDDIISSKKAEDIERVLSADSLRGRKVFTKDIEKAADFISTEFKTAGLKPLTGNEAYRQNFTMLRVTPITKQAQIDGEDLCETDVIVASANEYVNINEASGFDKTVFDYSTGSIDVLGLLQGNKNTIVFIDRFHREVIWKIEKFAKLLPSTIPTIIFIVGDSTAKHFTVKAKQHITRLPASNIIGILPGRSKPDEIVIFSGHYDHLGIGEPEAADSIYNGANDNASGVTAVILLARYFDRIKNNERTILFAAFTAEEIGEYGSAFFAKGINPAQVKAMINIDMIGTESKWGINSAYITGYKKSELGNILRKNSRGSKFMFYHDPYEYDHLFYRSDNAPLYRLGVPAYTISTAKIDIDPNYHKVSDQLGTLDLDNMAAIIKAIATSSQGIISGRDTPGTKF